MTFKMFVLQHKKDNDLFIKKLPFGSTNSALVTTRNIHEAERLYKNGARLTIYKNIKKQKKNELKNELKNYKMVEVEVRVHLKSESEGGQVFEQIGLF